MKKLLIFDLDGTLTESKSKLSDDMSDLLAQLLLKYSVAILSGGRWKQFETQLLSNLLVEDEVQEKLYLFPTCGTAFYRYQNKKWIKVYSEDLTSDQKEKIYVAFKKCFEQVGFVVPEKPLYGEIIEDRERKGWVERIKNYLNI